MNLNTKKFRIFVSLGEIGRDGIWKCTSDRSTEVFVDARNPIHACQIVEAQFGGPNRCRLGSPVEVR